MFGMMSSSLNSSVMPDHSEEVGPYSQKMENIDSLFKAQTGTLIEISIGTPIFWNDFHSVIARPSTRVVRFNNAASSTPSSNSPAEIVSSPGWRARNNASTPASMFDPKSIRG